MGHRKSVIAMLAALLLGVPRIASASLIGPTPYLSSADSPFQAESFSWFYVEDFEDGAFNTPGVTVSPWTAVIAVAGYTDSVDGDDGAIDGSGSGGQSLWSNFASSYFQFDFDAGTLGALPTHVGIVWTDVGQVTSGQYGSSDVTFEAFDQYGITLGVIGPFLLGDGSISGETAEDRFFGAINDGGISHIVIRSPNTKDWEVDNLQYGSVQPVPEPATMGLLLTGLGMIAARKWRRRRGERESSSAMCGPRHN
jgi:hypothetical protein